MLGHNCQNNRCRGCSETQGEHEQYLKDLKKADREWLDRNGHMPDYSKKNQLGEGK